MHTREFRLGQAIFAAELLVARARTRPEDDAAPACWVRCEDLATLERTLEKLRDEEDKAEGTT